MKENSIKLVSIVTLLLITSTGLYAKEKEAGVKEMKCHVELIGGRDIIHYVNVKNSQKRNIKELLTGQKIHTYAVKGEQVIYKVNTCIGLNDTFDKAAAKSADMLAVR